MAEIKTISEIWIVLGSDSAEDKYQYPYPIASFSEYRDACKAVDVLKKTLQRDSFFCTLCKHNDLTDVVRMFSDHIDKLTIDLKDLRGKI